MTNLMRNGLIVIGMLVSKWFAMLAVLSILSFISLFMLEAFRSSVVMLFTVIASVALGFLYAYSTKFLKNTGMKYKIVLGFLLLSVGLIFLYTQTILPMQALQNVSESLKELGGSSFVSVVVGTEPIADPNIILALYSLSFILAFGFYLRRINAFQKTDIHPLNNSENNISEVIKDAKL